MSIGDRTFVALTALGWIVVLILEWPWDRFIWYAVIVSVLLAAWYGVKALRARRLR